MSVEGIMEKITVDARAEAKTIIDTAQHEAESIREQGKREAQEYYERQKSLLDERYRKEKERTILNKRLELRKSTLEVKQKWMESAFSETYGRLVEQPLPEYRDLMITLISRVSRGKDEEVIFGKKGDEKLLEMVVKELNGKTQGHFTLARERRDFPWGFILKKGKVEINMSIDSLFRYKRSDIERNAWEIFNAGL